MKSKILIVFSLFVYVLNAQTIADKKVTWDFPVKRGTEEWKKFKNNEEKVNACQIPENIISSLSTEKLTDICLQYPLLYDIFAFNDMNEGIDNLFNDFNGIRELFKREQVSKELLKRYQEKIQNLSFLDKTDSSAERGLFIISISALEVLLCRYQLQTNATKENYKEILQNLVNGYEKKIMYVDEFRGFGLQTNFFSRAHVITKINEQFLEKLPQRNKNAVLISGMADEQSIRMIDELSYQLIK